MDLLQDLPPPSPRPGGVCGSSAALTSTVPSSRLSLWIFCGTYLHCPLVQVEFVDLLRHLTPLSPRPGGVCGSSAALTSTVPSSRWSLWIFCGTYLHCPLVQVEFVDLLRHLTPLSPRPGGVCGSSAGLTSTVPSSRWSLWIFCGITSTVPSSRWSLWIFCGLTSTVPSSRWSLWIFCGRQKLTSIQPPMLRWTVPVCTSLGTGTETGGGGGDVRHADLLGTAVAVCVCNGCTTILFMDSKRCTPLGHFRLMLIEN